jgi:aspartate aminotransferase-like enzyme
MEKEILNFMPGPVNLHPEVKKVYHDTFLSHRSEKFYADVATFGKKLCDFVHAKNVAFFVGSGTLGNEVVAQYLGRLQGKGLILVNGEFGKRIREQATYAQLDFHDIEWELGSAFDYKAIDRYVAENTPSWIWFVNCETSSGVLNDMGKLKKICRKHHVKLAADCISSIGNTPVDLKGIFLASGTSGKGLASYPGIAMVYYADELTSLSAQGIPKYMNLTHHKETRHVPYTISTNLFYSLVHAFKTVSHADHQMNIRFISDFIYRELSRTGFSFLGNYEEMMPGIISIVCPPSLSSFELGVELEQNGFYVNYGGSYLRKGNYFQICIMGHHEIEKAAKLVGFLKNKTSLLQQVKMAG